MTKSNALASRPDAPRAVSVVLHCGVMALVLVLVYTRWLPFPWRMPTVGLIGLAWVVYQTRGVEAFGLRRKSVKATLLWAIGLTLVHIAITPFLEQAIAHLTATPVDYSSYGALKGNLPATVSLIASAWLSAAIGEEFVFRGFLMHELVLLLGRGRAASVFAVLVGGIVFGAIHVQQGLSGMLLTGFVGITFCAAYLLSGRNLLAMILAHGLVDTWGVATLYFGIY